MPKVLTGSAADSVDLRTSCRRRGPVSGVHIAVDGTSLRIVGTVSQLAIAGRYEVLRAARIAV
jgi:hypothetical protein